MPRTTATVWHYSNFVGVHVLWLFLPSQGGVKLSCNKEVLGGVKDSAAKITSLQWRPLAARSCGTGGPFFLTGQCWAGQFLGCKPLWLGSKFTRWGPLLCIVFPHLKPTKHQKLQLIELNKCSIGPSAPATHATAPTDARSPPNGLTHC